MLSGLSPRTVVLGVALGGVLGKFLSDSAYVVLIPLGAVAFRAVGRSPMLGMIVAFVSINAAGDANPLIAPGDALFASVATEAAQLVDKDVVVRATDNMYFTTVSAFVLAGTIALVVDKILARREHHLIPDADLEAAAARQAAAAEVDDATELRALKLTGLAVLGYADADRARDAARLVAAARRGGRDRGVHLHERHRRLPHRLLPARRRRVRAAHRADQGEPRRYRSSWRTECAPSRRCWCSSSPCPSSSPCSSGPTSPRSSRSRARTSSSGWARPPGAAPC